MMTIKEFDWQSDLDGLPSWISVLDSSTGAIKMAPCTIPTTNLNISISVERQTMATEIMKGMVSSGLIEEPEEMAKEAVKIADALLAELRK